MDDVVLADFDYAKLDVDGAPIRVRLNSTAVAIANARDQAADSSIIGYIRAEALHRVQAKHCVLACYNMMIPHFMPELPAAQKQALALGVKMPLVYVNVALRNWHAFVKLGVDRHLQSVWLFFERQARFPVSLGGYRNLEQSERAHGRAYDARTADAESGTDERRAVSAREAAASRYPVRGIREAITNQLDRMLGGGGFKSARDIAAITVNRWPHGYAYDPNSLFDPECQGRRPTR